MDFVVVTNSVTLTSMKSKARAVWQEMCQNLQSVMDREPNKAISMSLPTPSGHKNSLSVMMCKSMSWLEFYQPSKRQNIFFKIWITNPQNSMKWFAGNAFSGKLWKCQHLLFSEPNSSSILAWIFDTGKSNISTARMEDRASSRVHDIRPGKQQSKLTQCGLGVLNGIRHLGQHWFS